jgi:hypothetical protein
MIKPRIVVSNWVHEEVLARLATVGEVDANRRRAVVAAIQALADAEACWRSCRIASMPRCSSSARG